MIHRMDPPADPDRRADARAASCRCSPAPARCRATTTRWAYEIKWDGVRAIVLLASPGGCASSAQPQRHHRALSRARAAQPRAELAPRDPRRRGRRLRRATAGPSFGALQRRMHVTRETAGAPAGEGRAGHLRDLRPAVARRPLADGAALRGAPRARWPSSRSTASAGRTPEHVVGQRRAAAGRQRRAGAGGHRRQAPGLPATSRAGAPARWVKIKNVHRQELRHRRLAAGGGAPRASASARCWSACARTARCATPAASAPGFTEAELDRLRGAARRRWRRDELAVRRPAARSRRAGAVFVEPRAASARSSSSSGRATASCARRPTRACATTSRPARRRDEDGREGRRGRTSTARELRLSNLDKVLYPEIGFTKGDLIDYYVAIAPVLLPHLARPAADAQALPQRRRGRVLLREAGAVAPARLGATARAGSGKTIDYVLAPGRGDARLAGATSPTSSCTRRSRRAADVATARRWWPSTSTRARRRRSSSAAQVGAAAAGDVRGPRPEERSPRPRAPRACRSTCRSTPRASPTTQTKAFAKAVAELLEQARRPSWSSRADQDAAQGQGARRLEPERRAQDDRLRLLAARARPPDGLHAADLGRGRAPRSTPATPSCWSSTRRRCCARVRRAGRPVRRDADAHPAASRTSLT